VITVHFVHGARSYLPELTAYQAHIEGLGHAAQMHTQPHTVPDDARAVWWICGRVPTDQARRFKCAVQVHEYASASVAPLAWLKDRIKQWLHPVPDFRVFQSDWVRQRMGFDDNLPDSVPYALRDMGVPDSFLTAQAQQPPEFDLVYLGEMRRLLHFVPLLHTLGQAGLSLLLVGDVPPTLQERLATLGHIQSTGRVPQDQVPAQLLRARSGLNLMPDVLPLSEQTSTKMLEYLALGLPVISNPYAWANRTAQAHAGRVQLLDLQASAAQWQAAVQGLPLRQTDRQQLQSLRWSHQLQGLPVWAALFEAGR
jgi:glycosyltransferase involved in cell wall biosynthesis